MVTLNEKHPNRRKNIRLNNFDYSLPGGYFITIVTAGRVCRFGSILEGVISYNAIANMVEKIWLSIPDRFPDTFIDEYIIMPNHFHGLLVFDPQKYVKETSDEISEPRHTLGDIVRVFKSITTHEYIIGVKQLDYPRFDGKLWQRNYYDHIVRDDRDLERVREYIILNPQRWDDDEENPGLEKHTHP